MGRYDLNLTEGDFWGLTLKELNALIERNRINKDWLDHRAALICTVLANAWRGKNVKPLTTEDFMPKVKVRSNQQTAKQMLSTVRLLNAAFGGKVMES